MGSSTKMTVDAIAMHAAIAHASASKQPKQVRFVSNAPCMPGHARSVFGAMQAVVSSAACMLGTRKTLCVFRFAYTERLKRHFLGISAYTERFCR